MDKRNLEVTKLCRRYGATVEKRRSGHFKICVNGRTLTASCSPKDMDTFLRRLERDLCIATSVGACTQTSLIGEATDHGLPTEPGRNL